MLLSLIYKLLTHIKKQKLKSPTEKWAQPIVAEINFLQNSTPPPTSVVLALCWVDQPSHSALLSIPT